MFSFTSEWAKQIASLCKTQTDGRTDDLDSEKDEEDIIFVKDVKDPSDARQNFRLFWKDNLQVIKSLITSRHWAAFRYPDF